MKKKIIFIIIMIFLIFITFAFFQFIPSQEKKQIKLNEKNKLTGEKLTVLTNHPHLKAAKFLAKLFYEETGIIVENIVVNYRDTLKIILEDYALENPKLDILMFWYIDLGKLVKEKILLDITSMIEENKKIVKPQDYIKSIYDTYTLYKGRRWGLPFDGDTHVLFYRKSLLKKYDLSPPETWDEYLKISKIITTNEKKNGIYGSAIMAPPIPIIIISTFMNRLGSYGGRLLDENGQPAVNSPEAIMALKSLIEHAKYALPPITETDWEVSRDSFLSGKVAMVEQWTDIGIMAEESTQSIISGDWGVVQMPKGSGKNAKHISALNAGFTIGIARSSKNIEVAKEYLLFANRPDITLKLNLINGGIDPTRKSILKSKKYKAFAPEVSMASQTAIHSAISWPTMPESHKLLNVLTEKIILVVEKKISPEDALNSVQEKWNKILKESINEN